MRYSDLKGHKVVSTSTADTVGKVDGFVLDPATRHLVALELKKTQAGSLVVWPDLAAVGTDVVTVADAEKVIEPDAELTELAGKDRSVLKKRVLTECGEDLGSVKDIDFDPKTGELRELLLSDATVAGERLLGIGSYAVVVADAG